MSASRYWHTLKHLRRRQIIGRLWFRVYQPTPDNRPAPARRSTARAWQPVEWREPSMLAPGTVTFLNVVGTVTAAADWNRTSHGRLWLYHLHYFDDLTSRGFEGRRAWHASLVDRWMTENQAGAGAGWEPYPTSLRISNWIEWALVTPSASAGISARMLDSLATQARWLCKRLERHILGNHLWANAKALVAAGVFFEGPEADAWRHRGLDILAAELDEQILPDGGHFERSPMYHAVVLEDVLDLVQVATVFPGVLPAHVVDRLRSAATRMLRWLRVMSHPDGQISFFNDAAFGVAAPYGVLADYAGGLAVEVDRRALNANEALPESGYLRLENDRATVLCDVAPIGPAYQPGHAHADTLSFELSVDGLRVVVNGGTSTYAPGPERDRQRGTAAHSTVEIDGVNSTDVWGGFRVARRARPFDIQSGMTEDRVWAEGAHDGYRHRPGQVVHRRAWSLDRGGLSVSDSLEGSCKRAVARFILHPAAAAPGADAIQIHCEPQAPICRVPTTWHSQFGHSTDTQAIEVTLTGPRITTHLRWS